MIKKKIMVNTSFRGTHSWPEASDLAGEDVEFLETEHRHTFHVKAELSVSDSDREVEFFIFQKIVDSTIEVLYGSTESSLVYRLGRRSCEHMCEEIINYLRKDLTNNTISVEVWEDKEVGARVDSIIE
jgi:hypothetical protein